MKLSISTLGCPGKSLDEAGELLFSCGVQGIEIRGLSGEMEAAKIECLRPDNIAETQLKLQRYGLIPVCFGSSISLHKMRDNITEGHECIDVCSRAGIPAIRVFGNNLPKDAAEREQTYQRIVDQINDLCAYAMPKKVQIWLETHGDIKDEASISPIIDACGANENFGLIWDIAHTQDDYQSFLKLIYPYIRHVHFKDQTIDEGGRVVVKLPGQGDLPLRGILLSLIDAGYDGFYSFEWEKKWHQEIEEPEIAFPYFVGFINGLLK